MNQEQGIAGEKCGTRWREAKGKKIGTTVNSIINKTYFKKEINKKSSYDYWTEY